MQDVFYVMMLVTTSIFMAFLLSVPQNRAHAVRVVLVAWFFLFVLLLVINGWMPFTGGGDDLNYYHYSGILRTSSELASPASLSAEYAQPGYVWMLNIINFTFSPGLLGLKAFNLWCFVVISLVWTNTVVMLDGAVVARKFLVLCLLLTPLWFYFFFLLKDLLIALIFAVFINGLASVWRSPKLLRGWIQQVLSVTALIPVRFPLVVQAGLIVLAVICMRAFRRDKGATRVLLLAFGVIMVAVIVKISASGYVSSVFGINGLTVHGLQDRASSTADASMMNRLLFPVLYILSEVSGFSAASWSNMDATWLRGVLVLPWIFFVVPFLPAGILAIGRGRGVGSQSPHPASSVSRGLLSDAPWVVILVFIASSISVSWIAGDTTRWRLDDMPALLIVAFAGWNSMSKDRAAIVVTLWAGLVVIIYAAYSLFR